MNEKRIQALNETAREIRRLTVDMVANLGQGHLGGALSIVDALAVLYFEEMKIKPENPEWRERDRFILSKGHAGPALYATLAHRGYFPESELHTLNLPNTNLPSHCDMKKTKGIDMTAGSLGQGFSAAVGMAIGAKIDLNPCWIYTLIGDGESQEGQIWEAAMLAGNKHLNNLIAFLDVNKLQIDGFVKDINSIEPAQDKWNAFGWHTQRINGHDVGAIYQAIHVAQELKDKPSMIIMDTIKGKGVSFAEGQISSHHMALTKEQWANAIAELV